MKKRIFKSLLFSSLLLLSSCGSSISSNNENTSTPSAISSNDNSSSIDYSYELPKATQEFVDFVNNIEFNLHSQDQINQAYAMYNALNDDEWNYDEVFEAFETLVQMEALLIDYNYAARFVDEASKISYFATSSDLDRINELLTRYANLSEIAKQFADVEYQYERLLTIKENVTKNEEEKIAAQREIAIQSFLSQVDALPDVMAVTLDDDTKINNVYNFYNTLDTIAKEDARVIEAYATLAEVIARYELIRDDPTVREAALVARFLDDVDKLPTIEDVVVTDLDKINNATSSYYNLSGATKELPDVVTAYSSLCNVKDKYKDVYDAYVYAEKLAEIIAKVTPFINAVDALGNMEDLTKASLSAVLACFDIYEQLDLEARSYADTEVAYTKICNFKDYIYTHFTFEALTNDVTAITPNASYHPALQFTVDGQVSNTNAYKNLMDFYGVTSYAELATKVAMYLYFYTDLDSPYVARGNISDNTIKNGANLLSGSNVVKILEAASVYDENLVSGAFYIGVGFEDLTSEYAASEIYIKKDQKISYSFTSQYVDDEEETITYVEIHNAEELLAIDGHTNYILTNDIDVSGIEWKNLGKYYGIFDGNGYAITNITRDNGGDSNFGIFEEIVAGAEVRNLGLYGKVENAGTWAGAIAVRNKGTISNCYLNLNIKCTNDPLGDGTYSDQGCIGGICTENFGTINNTIVVSKIQGTSTAWGMNLDGGICCGQYGEVNNTYFIGENVSSGKAVGNNGSLNLECLKTESDLKNAALFASYDKAIWMIVDGAIPVLRNI